MAGTGIALNGLAAGVEWTPGPSGVVSVGASRSIHVYKRNTNTEVQVYSDEGLTTPIAQPLTTDAAGDVPGYVAGEQSIDFFDVLSGDTGQAEAVSAPDVVDDTGVDPTSPISASASPRNRALRDFVSALDYGTYTSGDMTSTLLTGTQDAQTRGKKFYLPGVPGGGSYLCSGQITNTGNKNPLIIEGDDPYVSVLAQASGITESLIETIGSIGAAISITSAVAARTNVLQLTSTAGLAVGDVLLLRDITNTTFTGTTRTVAGVLGEYARIYSVDSGTQVTLHEVLELPYSTSADVRLLTGQQVRVEGIGFQNNAPLSQASTAQGLSVHDFQGFIARHLRFVGFDGACLYMEYGIDFTIDDIEFQDCQELAASGGLESGETPYCITADLAVHNGLISHVRSRYGRHLFTASGGSTSEVGAAFVNLDDCIATEHGASSFDTHPGARRITFSDCTAHGSFPTGGTSAVHGFQIRGPDTSLYNCKVITLPTSSGSRTAYGISVYAGADRCRIHGGRLDGTDFGVVVQDAQDCYIGGGLLINSPVQCGIETILDAAWTAFVSDLILGDVDITGNPSIAGINNASGITLNYL